MSCSAYYGLDLSGKLFPSLAPNDWWFAKLNMWHESMWFWNPGATQGGGAVPAHLGARFADETCFADALHSYDEHVWRPMITDDAATGGERMASKPVRRAALEGICACVLNALVACLGAGQRKESNVTSSACPVQATPACRF